MNFLFFLTLVIGGLCLSKRLRGYDLVVIAFLTYLSFSVQNIPDFKIYEIAYEYIGSGHYYTDLGTGWYYLCAIGSHLGLSYGAFKGIITLISLLMIRSTINWFSTPRTYTGLCWALYLIYPALLDIVQIRFMLAEAIVLFSLRFLLGNYRGGMILYIVCVLFAFLIHSSSIFYLLFVFEGVFRTRRSIVFVLTICEAIVVMLAGPIVIRIASLFVNQGRIERYFQVTNSVGFFGFLAYLFTLVIIEFIVERLYDSVSRSMENVRVLNLMEFIKSSTRISWLILPLTLFDTNFFRIQRPIWLLLFIALSLSVAIGVRTIKIGTYNVSSRDLVIVISVIANLFFICVFAFPIISGFLF